MQTKGCLKNDTFITNTMVMSSRLQEHGQTATGKTKELGEALGHNSPREQKTLNESQTESPITGGGEKR